MPVLFDQCTNALQTEIGETYPAVELEWIAAKSFNYAIDLRSKGLETDFERWIQLALSLSKLSTGEGRQHDEMQEKYQRLLRSCE